MDGIAGDEPSQFDWAALVPLAVHAVRVAIIEALQWIDQPLSASQFQEVFDQEFSLSLISYHVKVLAEAGALDAVGSHQGRGALQTFYFFPKS